MRRDPLIIGLLLLLTFVAFAGVTRCDFVAYDDQLYVTENPHVRAGLTLEGLRWAITTDHTGYWHPLTWLSLMIDASLFGPDNPAGFHAVNLAIHAVNVVLLFLLLRGLTGESLRAGLLAAVWAVHPLRVESVAWVAERKDVLTAMLGLLTLLAYAAYARRGGLPRYALLAGLYALCLAAKPMLVSLPGVMLLLDYWPLRRLRLGSLAAAPLAGTSPEAPACPPAPLSRLILEKLPLLALAMAAALAAAAVQASQKTLATLEGHPLSMRLSNAAVAYGKYLVKMVRFDDLAICYPFPPAPPIVAACVVGLLLLLISLAALWRVRGSPWLAVGWFWYLGSLLPAIGLVQSGEQSMADRYTYFPTLGILLLIVWSIPASWFTLPHPRLALGLGLAAVLAVEVGFTVRQVGFWADSESLFARAVAVTKRNHRAHVGYALALSQRGDDYAAAEQLQWALDVRPRDAQSLNNLGNILGRRGDLPGAIALLKAAIEADPRYAEAWSNLGNMVMTQGDNAAAAEDFRKAIELNRTMFVAHHNLGLALARMGKHAEALEAFNNALALRPEMHAALIESGKVLIALNQPAMAAARFQAVLERDQTSAPAMFGLARALELLGRNADAVALYRAGLRLAPRGADADDAMKALTRLSSQPAFVPSTAP